ncbi:hypothetical protein D1BOALGB6SA_5700 [Olavius sp. associated proteobacterium Delta 1]|nr:hypothetical protein D1BOALGB6SA_5700 [Olavius sp. associated proteobacterium Delta 1]
MSIGNYPKNLNRNPASIIPIIFLLSDLKYEIFLNNSLGGQKTASDEQIPAPAENALHLI